MSDNLKIIAQAFMEVQHAQHSGAQWYTRGEDGLYAQVAMWMRRGTGAVIDLHNQLLWQPIETAPQNQRILLWLPAIDGARPALAVFGKWCADQYNLRPRPYWDWEGGPGLTYIRARQPTHWRTDLTEGPSA